MSPKSKPSLKIIKFLLVLLTLIIPCLSANATNFEPLNNQTNFLNAGLSTLSKYLHPDNLFGEAPKNKQIDPQESIFAPKNKPNIYLNQNYFTNVSEFKSNYIFINNPQPYQSFFNPCQSQVNSIFPPLTEHYSNNNLQNSDNNITICYTKNNSPNELNNIQLVGINQPIYTDYNLMDSVKSYNSQEIFQTNNVSSCHNNQSLINASHNSCQRTLDTTNASETQNNTNINNEHDKQPNVNASTDNRLPISSSPQIDFTTMSFPALSSIGNNLDDKPTQINSDNTKSNFMVYKIDTNDNNEYGYYCSDCLNDINFPQAAPDKPKFMVCKINAPHNKFCTNIGCKNCLVSYSEQNNNTIPDLPINMIINEIVNKKAALPNIKKRDFSRLYEQKRRDKLDRDIALHNNKINKIKGLFQNKYPKHELLKNMAVDLSKKSNIKICSTERSKINGILCWIVKNWEQLLPHLKEIFADEDLIKIQPNNL